MNFTISMKLEKETKGAVRYKEVGESNVVGTIYIRKAVLAERRPKAITVHIQEEQSGS